MTERNQRSQIERTPIPRAELGIQRVKKIRKDVNGKQNGCHDSTRYSRLEHSVALGVDFSQKGRDVEFLVSGFNILTPSYWSAPPPLTDLHRDQFFVLDIPGPRTAGGSG
jgi:hypothetical protein